MDLSPSLLESLVMAAITGLCFWLWHLKGKIEELKEEVHDLEKSLISEYVKKAELREAMTDALGPLRESIGEMKQELRHTMRELEQYRMYGPPE